MAEGVGVFDDLEMKDIEIKRLESYTDDQLTDEYESKLLELDSLLKRGGNKGPIDVQVKSDAIGKTLDAIEYLRESRVEKLMAKADFKGERSVKIASDSFIDNDGGKTITIEKLGDPIEAPSSSILTTLKRNITLDKKDNIRRILGMDHQFRVRDGKVSKGLLKDTTVVFDGKGKKVLGLSYKGVRVYVSDDFGKSFRKTTNRNSQDTIKEFGTAVEKATEEYSKFEEEKQNYPLVDTTPKTDDIHGLTSKENSELRGSLTPNKSIDPTTRPEFLKIQADHFQETINETLEIKGKNSLEGFELRERVTGLEEARDRTLNQLQIEETRESQEEDISRLRRFKEWAKRNMAALAGLAISIAGIITTVIVSARTIITKGAQATGKFAKAVYKTFKDIAKKLGPILGPVISAIGSLLSILLKYAAEGIAWLAKNLWALVIAILFFIYSRYQGKK